MSNILSYTVLVFIGVVFAAAVLFTPSTAVAQPTVLQDYGPLALSTQAALLSINEQIHNLQAYLDGLVTSEVGSKYHDVPFYSQFTDISSPTWQKVGCGIASTAMLIDFYSDRPVNVEALLQKGIQKNAYLPSAGWIHSGLIGLAHAYGLQGQSLSLQQYSMSEAFNQLREVVAEGPVMVSVHYTFQPTNPIPHLAVVTGVDDSRVYYNDPAETSGQNSISIEQFKSAWKKRYIEIRPTG